MDGNDTFTSELNASHQLFVGGDGSDTYIINAPEVMTIFDGGTNGSDHVCIDGIGLS